MPLDELTPYHRNPRRGNVDLIVESLDQLGQYRPIVVNAGSMTGRPFEVLAGNHTLAAARRLGWRDIEVHVVDVDEDTATRILLVDNRSNDRATYDEAELAKILDALPSLDATGWTDEDLAALLDVDGDPADSGAQESYAERFELVVECGDEAQQASLYERFTAEGLTCRLLTL